MQVLIYVFDIESRELSKDMEYYASCLSAVKQNSKNAKIFCLVHKMDLIPEEQRDPVFRQRERELMRLAQPLGNRNMVKVPPSRATACYSGRPGCKAFGLGCSTYPARAPPPLTPQWQLMLRPSARAKAADVAAFDHPGLDVTCFKTSIWDETLYRAWSMMARSRSSRIGRP